MRNSTKISKVNINFNQPRGLHIIAFMSFCLCLCIAPFMTILNDYGNINFFYNRNDYFFVIFFAGIFGCISNYIFGSTKSIIHGLQFIIVAIILSFINNMILFSCAALWIGLAIVIVNLLFNLSAFYLKTDIRRIYGFIGVYSSALLGVAVGIIIYFLILKSMYYFKILYFFIVIFLLLFFLKNSYKLNTSLTSQTERINISFYGVLLIFFIFAFILFYLLVNLNVFSSLNLVILPLSLIYLHVLTISNNKENGKNLLKYIYFSLALIVINKIFYLSFLRYENVVDPKYLNSAISTFLFLLAGYLLCIIVYFGWRFKLITLRIESITNSNIIKIMLYIEAIRVFILIIIIFTNNILVSNIMIMIATILALILNIFIVPIYFSLGKILAGGKNEIITTTLLYLIFSSLIFVSFLYDISISL
ncbi:hypothetical protein [Francisella hispaniensis]|uniref:Hypothetical membrane protein n=1 Tax=Francisella hispaniensis TaxID=622488 RepID=F4BG67_9GAMM|nr:hypothetical protein [Francisella hispaniensis]AEE26461.1 hypothetical membrane protein [Francisella hispaniensis]